MSQIPNKMVTHVDANGVLTPTGGASFYAITKVTSPVTVCAITLGAPTADGQEVTIIDAVGGAHTLTATSLFAGGGKSLLTWNGTEGSATHLVAINGYSWVEGIQGVAITS